MNFIFGIKNPTSLYNIIIFRALVRDDADLITATGSVSLQTSISFVPSFWIGFVSPVSEGKLNFFLL